MSPLIDLCCTSVYSPSDYRPPPNSPHARINLSRPHTATPSGVPQSEKESVVVPRLPNSIRCTEEDNHLKPHRTSHNLAHSIGLPKPPGYNLEWPHVTPIQDTLVTKPPAKASHREHHLKMCTNPPCVPTLHACHASRVVRRNLVPNRPADTSRR